MYRKLGDGKLCSMDWTVQPDIHLGAKLSRVAARGTLCVRILDAETLLASLGGTDPESRMEKRVTRVVRDRLTAVLDHQVHRAEELDSRFNEVATEARLGLKHQLHRMGLDLVDFTILGLGFRR